MVVEVKNFVGAGSMKKVMIMAGGTGGHVFPALACAKQFEKIGWQVHWLGTESGFEARIVPKHNIAITYLTAKPARGKTLKQLLSLPFSLMKAFWQARRVMKSVKPDCVIGFGGYVSAPGGVMAKCLGLPLLIHEQNAVAGMTNRFLARLASRVLVAFPDAFEQQFATFHVGNPVRKDLERLTAEPSAPTQRILVLGGSQGARSLNQALPQVFNKLSKEYSIEIRHQCGRSGEVVAKAHYDEYPEVQVSLQPFIDDMAEAYQWADIVIARAGALTVSELMAVGRASILIPYPHAVDDHQLKNARVLERAGATKVVIDDTHLAENTLEHCRSLLDNREFRIEMGNKAHACHLPGSALQVVTIADALVRDRVDDSNDSSKT